MAKIPEPEYIKNGEHLEMWKALWEARAQLDVVSREIRIGLAIAIAVFIAVVVG